MRSCCSIVKCIIGICFSVPVITAIANSEIEPPPSSYFTSGIQKSCCKSESLSTILDTAHVISTTLQELISTVKSKAEDVSDTICRSAVDEQRHECNISSAKENEIYSDCYSVLQKSGKVKTSGIYKIWPKFYKEPFEIFCDMDTGGGGWSVFQRRGDYSPKPSVDFYRTWNTYKNGFGNLSEEFWLGNDKLFALTNSGPMTLRIDMEDFENVTRFAQFETFVVDGEIQNYKMTLTGHTGDAGDSFLKHDGNMFVTKDLPNKCPFLHKGGWWYGDCHQANLNGLYLRGKHDTYADGVNYESFKGYHYSLKFTEMKLRTRLFKDE